MTWRCAKCDGADVPHHFRTCPRRGEDDENLVPLDTTQIHRLQQRTVAADNHVGTDDAERQNPGGSPLTGSPIDLELAKAMEADLDPDDIGRLLEPSRVLDVALDEGVGEGASTRAPAPSSPCQLRSSFTISGATSKPIAGRYPLPGP
jgi:hypothetical protein